MRIKDAKIGMTVMVNDTYTAHARGTLGVITGFSRNRQFISVRMYRQSTRYRLGRVYPKGELSNSLTSWHPSFLSPASQAEIESRL